MRLMYKNKKVAVIGFGMEGKDIVKFMLKNNADITVLDLKDEKDLDKVGIKTSKIKFVTGSRYLSDLSTYDLIVRSPGVYPLKKELIKAGSDGVEVTTAVNIFLSLCKGKVVGVTGTKGKGTTSTIIYKILKAAGKRVFLAGNIGKPYLELLPLITKNTWVVLELSSGQLMDIKTSPHVSVVLNITSDHLDWHKNKKEYLDAKKRIMAYQQTDDYAVINADYKIPESFSLVGKSSKYFVSTRKKVSGAYVKNGKIYLNINKCEELGETKKLLLRGKHNWENVTAGICAASLAGVDTATIRKVIFRFRGLEHRLELVKEISGVSFYNDSFATGPQPTIAAVNAFDEDMTLILGGRNKGLDYKNLYVTCSKKTNLKTVLLMGEMANEYGVGLEEYGFEGNLINLGYSNMVEVTKTAMLNTGKGGVVVFSPGATSFDMFDNYKQRGELFKKAVRKL